MKQNKIVKDQEQTKKMKWQDALASYQKIKAAIDPFAVKKQPIKHQVTNVWVLDGQNQNQDICN